MTSKHPDNGETTEILKRIAEALERAYPPPPQMPEEDSGTILVWHGKERRLEPVKNVRIVDEALLCGIDRQKETLLTNTRQFAQGYSANNALLWGARGMGKSTLVKTVHALVNSELQRQKKPVIMLIEVHRNELETLLDLLSCMNESGKRAILFCDDLSFEHDETAYKSLKSVLEGGIVGNQQNILFYATSNRRHLLARDMKENEQSSAINPSDAIEEKVSLSDRFGLWLGFHKCSQDEYLDIVEKYLSFMNIADQLPNWRALSLDWAITRGGRSGRVAWQFIQDQSGKLKLG